MAEAISYTGIEVLSNDKRALRAFNGVLGRFGLVGVANCYRLGGRHRDGSPCGLGYMAGQPRYSLRGERKRAQ